MRLRRAVLTLSLLALSAIVPPSAAQAAPPGPAWSIDTSVSSPANFGSGKDRYTIQVTNTGSVATDPGKPITVTDYLPPGLTVNTKVFGFSFFATDDRSSAFPECEAGPPATCTLSTDLPPGQRLYMYVPVNVAPDTAPVVTNHVSVQGGGAGAASDSTQTTISQEPSPFELQNFESWMVDSGGAAVTQAGAHPYSMRFGTQFKTNLTPNAAPPAESPKELIADLPPGVVLNPLATPVRCTEAQLETFKPNSFESECPDASAVGIVHLSLSIFGASVSIQGAEPLYNMVPAPGRPAEFAFNVASFGIFIHLRGRIRSDGDYGLSSDTLDAPQLADLSGVSADLWGDPSDPSHDQSRGNCIRTVHRGTCSVSANETPFLTMPSACSGPLVASFHTNSWQHPEHFLSASTQLGDTEDNPKDIAGCDKLSYNPKAETVASTDQAETGSGLDVNVDLPNNGLFSKTALSESMTEKAVVTLPEGVTINPSVGEGLGFCTPSQYAKEQTFSEEGEGCPGDSKIGTLNLTSPLVDEALNGSVYLAQQDNPATTEHGAENPFDTDVALYLVLRNTQLGVMVKQALKVIPDPKTGQLVATLENIPQLPFSHFNFHFKEGARAALITPAACGKYTTVSKFYPSSDPSNPKVVKSDFEITKGVHGGPCPPAGTPPFHPRFEAGSVNNNAKSFSPFDMRLTRADGEQDMTKFGAILPPGVLGKLAGISKCSDAAIASAKTKTGRQELASPSCPASSLVGHTSAGAGVGDSLTYVPGKLYLGGAYHGDPLSVVSITPALAGPFDAGTVVVREALTLNPVTAEVEVDGAGSDPIPHILKGIVLKVRDLRVNVDRPEFILNPTSCERSSAKATLFGANLNVFDPSDDVPVDLSTPYQAASCASLGFKPKLSINLNGGTKRGDHPALKAVVTARNADANIGKAVVTLPQSAFLDQAHIRTICTRVQYAANGGAGAGCPKAAQYGYARAFTPLLDEPVEGPVYLRSSNHKLPDLVAALHGIVNVDIVGRIDSFKGGIRSSFETVPDAPVSKFILNMQGGKKGLVVNSRNLCAATNKANAALTGQNGVPYDFKPVVKPSCGGKRKHKKGHGRG